MARYKTIDTSPRFLAVDLEAQLLPGTFEHALDHLLDREIDLSGFDARFRNDDTGASAYPPGMLLKVVLLAYSRGIVSSRAIERACREHVTFIALSGDTCPHFTTIAAFVSGLGDLVGKVFQQVLLICDAQGLIGREMFAIDCRLAAVERFQGAQRHARRLCAPGAEDGGCRADHARAARRERRCRNRALPARQRCTARRTPAA